METFDVVTFGEAMAMFMADSIGPLHETRTFSMELAGAETNVAIGLARLGFKTSFVSKVGHDAFGKFIMKKLQEHQVQTDHIAIDTEHPTGFQLKSKVEVGDPEVQYFRKGSAASTLSADDFDEDYFLRARHLHMTGIPLAISESARDFAGHALKFMKQHGKTISFDTNLRPSLWNSEKEMIHTINFFAKQTDYVLPGISEGKLLTGYETPEDIASYYLDAGVHAVIVKLGERGAYYKTLQEEGYVKGMKVPRIIDTVGAGDGFAVGVISGLLEKIPLEQAIARGNAIGALAVQSSGDNTGYPNKQKLLAYLTKHDQGVN
ncbi:sugar kinase [Terrilactibacillus sp. BCM23-1]|uniref:Sugar kinase n=1 Tax=Terrilactibacillus tamarindi TaxID=2599694 RepID=A0A6N8CTL9_9BACI|nr:sugar kinase [Terrilactibacillus tamarindi]MTT32403.1 sugar kinase [Terrilactibacillus tamarindi]